MQLPRRIYIGLTASLLLLSAPAIAQVEGQTGWTGMLEEVVVTAQKREETLQDVPISIIALSGETVRDLNIYKMEDLQLKVPNLQMTESGISTQIYIRGIGTGNNQGFEQSVGMYVDGIYYGRQQLIRLPIFDIQRVEVLRRQGGHRRGHSQAAGHVEDDVQVLVVKPHEEARVEGVLDHPLAVDLQQSAGRVAAQQRHLEEQQAARPHGRTAAVTRQQELRQNRLHLEQQEGTEEDRGREEHDQNRKLGPALVARRSEGLVHPSLGTPIPTSTRTARSGVPRMWSSTV